MRIAVLAHPGVQLLDVIGPTDVFAEASRLLGTRAYEPLVVATEPGPLEGSSGLRLLPDRTIADAVPGIDTLIVAGGPSVRRLAADEEVLSWLRRRVVRVRRYGSVCTGAFVLAAAGLLEGRRVTTHWNEAARLAALHPDLEVEPDRLFVRDGPVFTSAGVTAGMDLALALVEEDHGRELALQVARQLVMFLKRPGGQSQFSAHLAAQTAEKSAIQAVQERVLASLRADHSVPAMAKRAGMSPRNFSRVFKEQTGATPADFVEAARLDEARRLLEESRGSLAEIAEKVGFAEAANLRRAFVRRLGMTPREYRRRFSARAGAS